MAPKKRSSIRDISRQPPRLSELFFGSDSPSVDADRATAIVKAADLESALEGAMAYKMVALSRRRYENLFTKELAPLRNFSSKIAVAHAFDIIGNRTHQDLTCIRLVRNAFAHARRPISFQTPEVEEECSKLNCIEKADDYKSKFKPLDNARSKYLFATSHITIALAAIATPEVAAIHHPLLTLD